MRTNYLLLLTILLGLIPMNYTHASDSVFSLHKDFRFSGNEH